MKKLAFKRVKTLLTFWFLLISFVPLLIIFKVNYDQRVSSIKEREYAKLSAIRDLKVLEMNEWLDYRTEYLQTIAHDHEIIRALETLFQTSLDKRDDNPVLSTIRHSFQHHYLRDTIHFSEIFIINATTGQLEISTNQLSEGQDRSRRGYFTEPLRTGEIHISDIYYSTSINKASMVFSMPIYCLEHKGSHIIGVLVGRTNLEDSLYSMLLNPLGLDQSGEILLINKEAVVLNELRWHRAAPLILQLPKGMAMAALHGDTGISETIDYRQEKVLSAYTYLPRFRWGFIIKQDLKELYRPLRLMFFEMLGICLLAMTAILLVVIFIAQYITRPLLDMMETSQKIEQGDLSARSRIKRDDEFGYLAKSFNQMADSICSQMTLQETGNDLIKSLVISRNLEDFGQRLILKLLNISGSSLAAFYLLNEKGNLFEPLASIGLEPRLQEPFDALKYEGEFGRALITREIAHLSPIPDDTIFTLKTFAGTAHPKEIITIPLLVEERVMAMIALASLKPYAKEVFIVLNSTWMSMSTAFATLLANTKTQRLADELESKNNQLQAQTEELQTQTEELLQQAEELQEQNVELETQRQQVEEADRLKSSFLSNMSHELRTPLNSINVLSHILSMQAHSKLSPEESKYLEIIERNGKTLLNLINDLLDLSKIEAGKAEVNPRLFSIVHLVELIVERLQPLAQEKGLIIHTSFPDSLPPLESDVDKVQQILQNIISNAVKFTEQGKITISACYEKDTFSLKVEDTGIGIPAHNLPHIFSEFQQGDASPSSPYGGTGLGLTIALKAAHLIGGSISVESMLNKGSTFTITLPVSWSMPLQNHKQVEMKQIIKSQGKERSEGEDGVEQIVKLAKKGKRILLVEDSEAIILQMKRILEPEDYLVEVAEDGDKAIEYLKEPIPDGIILDLMIPKTDGFIVLEKIRASQVTQDLPVLIMTAKDLSGQDLEKLKACHIQQFVQKGNVDQRTLLLKIKHMLKVGEPEKNLTPPALLIIEDNPDNMTTIKSLLQEKYLIMEASDGEKGFKSMITHPPDLILLDITLPGMDGLALIRKIKSEKKIAHLPVIAVTAHAMKGDREKILEAGCDDYVSKPIDPELLIQKIEENLYSNQG